MLLEFSFKNYRSFRDEVTFSMIADQNAVRTNKENYLLKGDTPILRTSVIYGPNAGGKSNFAMAYYYMLLKIRNSFGQNEFGRDIQLQPFCLEDAFTTKPSMFEIALTLEDDDTSIFTFGFEQLESKITKEWLFIKKIKTKKATIYSRSENSIYGGDALPNKDVIKIIAKQDLLRDDTLLFSLLDSLNNPLVKKINEQFFQKNIAASALFLQKNELVPQSVLKDSALKKAYLYLLKKADTGIEDFRVKPDSESNSMEIQTAHTVLNNDGNSRLDYFDFKIMESRGTQKVFNLLGTILSTLKTGGVLLIDEIDTQLHPHLTRLLFNLFLDSSINLRNAQLIAISHEEALLNHPQIRKDQVWFVEKDSELSSQLYSLVDFVDERSVHVFGKRYLSGQYGAVPEIGDTPLLTNLLFGEENE